jgi:hypothetical protein
MVRHVPLVRIRATVLGVQILPPSANLPKSLRHHPSQIGSIRKAGRFLTARRQYSLDFRERSHGEIKENSIDPAVEREFSNVILNLPGRAAPSATRFEENIEFGGAKKAFLALKLNLRKPPTTHRARPMNRRQ